MSPYDEDWMRFDCDPAVQRMADYDSAPAETIPVQYRGGVGDFDNPAVYAEEDDPREELAGNLRALAYGLDPYADVTPAPEPWPPSDEWFRRLMAVVAKVERARQAARRDANADEETKR